MKRKANTTLGPTRFKLEGFVDCGQIKFCIGENMIHKVPQINNWPQCAYFAKNGRFQIDLQHELCKAELNHVTF